MGGVHVRQRPIARRPLAITFRIVERRLINRSYENRHSSVPNAWPFVLLASGGSIDLMGSHKLIKLKAVIDGLVSYIHRPIVHGFDEVLTQFYMYVRRQMDCVHRVSADIFSNIAVIAIYILSELLECVAHSLDLTP